MDTKTLISIIKENALNKNLGIITEAKFLKGSGKHAERHTSKYIAPIAISNKSSPNEVSSNLSLIKAMRNEKGKTIAQPGSKLVPIKGTTREIDGKYHSDFHVVHKDGSSSKLTLPHTSVNVESDKSGRHVDEHAVIRAWNHFSEHFDGKKPSLEEMHSEIENARRDPSHPLHIKNVPKSEFIHGINGHDDAGSEEVRKRAENTYYNNMRNASHTISALANHPDFKSHWKNKDVFEGAGRSQPELSDLYKESGVKGAGATSKADVITVRSRKPGYKALKLISLKDEKGSQLMSSSPAEFEGIYRHALRKHMEAGHITQAEHDTHIKTIKRIRTHLENGDHEKADAALQSLHNRLDK